MMEQVSVEAKKDLGSLSYSTADLKLIEMVFTLMM